MCLTRCYIQQCAVVDRQTRLFKEVCITARKACEGKGKVRFIFLAKSTVLLHLDTNILRARILLGTKSSHTTAPSHPVPRYSWKQHFHDPQGSPHVFKSHISLLRVLFTSSVNYERFIILSCSPPFH